MTHEEVDTNVLFLIYATMLCCFLQWHLLKKKKKKKNKGKFLSFFLLILSS